jgi:hypothetical protein
MAEQDMEGDRDTDTDRDRGKDRYGDRLEAWLEPIQVEHTVVPNSRKVTRLTPKH